MQHKVAPEALISTTIIWSDDIENLRELPS